GAILRGGVAESAIEKFLLAQNKSALHETALQGGVEALRDFSVKLPSEVLALRATLVDTCGTGGDGQHTFNISTAAALVAAGCGVKGAKHWNRSFSSSSGSADCLEALGIDIENNALAALTSLNKTAFAFLYAPLFYPAMKQVLAVRKTL